MNVEDLLEDAHLVSSFGQRAGVLKSPDLFTAIHHAEVIRQTLSWSSAEAATLQTALNLAIQDIAPVTLLNLKEGFDPFKGQEQSGKKLRLVLIGAALLLLGLGAHYSIWQEGATNVLQEIAKNKYQSQEEVVNRLLPTVVEFEKAGVNFDELEDANSLARGAFRDQVSKAQQLAREMVEDNRRFTDYSISFYPGWPWISNLLAANAGTAQVPPKPAGAKPEQFPALLSNLGPYSHCFRAKTASFIKAVNLTLEMPDYQGVYLFGTLVERDQSLMQRVRCLVGLEAIERQIKNTAIDRSEMEAQLDMLNVWVLPAFYGMLGAIIFHLRICMNPMRPDPDGVRVVLRTFLGGFAGVAIAWFWRPDSTTAGAFAEIGLGALSVAFLAGFSIDAFFTLLDRVVHLMNQSAANLGAPKTNA